MVHNLDKLSALPLTADPKWVIGFSDISALHALMASKDIASIHSSMAKQVALGPDNDDNARFCHTQRRVSKLHLRTQRV